MSIAIKTFFSGFKCPRLSQLSSIKVHSARMHYANGSLKNLHYMWLCWLPQAILPFYRIQIMVSLNSAKLKEIHAIIDRAKLFCLEDELFNHVLKK
jgi:hypothetical protein